MLERLRLAIAKAITPQLAQRRFDAAAGGARWSGTPGFGRIGAEVLGAAAPVRSRARYFAANNAWARNGVDALANALTGAGITPASKHSDPTTRKALAAGFSQWSIACDADGLTDFAGLQAAATIAMIEDGEAFIQIINTADGPQLRLLPAEQIDPARTMALNDGHHVIAGVEFDASGRRVAYYVSPYRPTDIFQSQYWPPIRVPADQMVHLFRPMGAGQVRGISWLAPVLLRLSELDQLEDALLVGAKVSAMHAGFLIDLNGTQTNPYSGDQTGSVLESGLEPGTLKWLPTGVDVKFSAPQQAQQSIEFAQLQLRAVAAGLGLPEYMLTGDLRGANYSSLRAGLVAFRQRVEQIQFGTIIHQLVRPVWQHVATHLVLSGQVDAAELSDALAAEFYPPAQPWVDPMKDAEAEAAMVAAGFKSRRQVVAAQGFDIEDVDAEIAADQVRADALGLKFIQPGVLPNAA